MTENEWRAKTDKRLFQIEARLNSIDTRDAVADVHRENVEKRLTSIESTLTWLVRLVIGAMLLAVVGFAMSGGFAPA